MRVNKASTRHECQQGMSITSVRSPRRRDAVAWVCERLIDLAMEAVIALVAAAMQTPS